MSGSPDKPLSKNETIKAESRHLRGNIKDELAEASSDNFSKESMELLKFHGIYQQDNRDERVKTKEGTQKAYSMMIRGRIPGGRLNAKQYQIWDDLAVNYGGGSLRITTRQAFQFHGILKSNLKATIQGIHDSLLTSEGACGDVVRNVTQAVNPLNLPTYNQLDGVADLLSDHFKAKSHAYHEIWLDEEEVNPADEREPIYGETYLPRKFKIGLTVVGDNGIDLYTNDLGLAATFDGNDTIDGYFVFAGGGLGMSHRNPSTYPRAASLLGWIAKDHLIPVSEGVVTTQRDNGDRVNRKHARLKYLIEERGVDWFRNEVELRSGVKFDTERALPPWETPNYLGWKERQDGSWALGIHTLSGRIKDRENFPIRSFVRKVVDHCQVDVQLTADQDLILLNISAAQKADVETLLSEYGINPESPAPLYDRALACPALPTCGLAITESERYLPELLPQIESVLNELELSHRAPVVRMTGCPNGCARPYSAELGFVGRTVGAYALFVGGDPAGTRVGSQLIETLKLEDIQPFLRRLFTKWKSESQTPDEAFGNYAYRMGVPALQDALGIAE